MKTLTILLSVILLIGCAEYPTHPELYNMQYIDCANASIMDKYLTNMLRSSNAKDTRKITDILWKLRDDCQNQEIMLKMVDDKK